MGGIDLTELIAESNRTLKKERFAKVSTIRPIGASIELGQ